MLKLSNYGVGSGFGSVVAERNIDTRIGSCEFAGVFFNHVPFPSFFRQSVYIACEQGTCNRKQAKAYYLLIRGTTKVSKFTERANPSLAYACKEVSASPPKALSKRAASREKRARW